MKLIRILLVGQPQILLDIVERTFEQEPDMTVVGQNVGEPHLPPSADLDQVDFVVLGLEGQKLSDVSEDLILRHPGTKWLAIGGHGRECFLYLGEVWPERLVETIRAAHALEG